MISFYPKQVQTNIQRRKHFDTERVFRGVSASDKDHQKALHKMKQLADFQSQMINCVMTKIQRKQSPVQNSTRSAHKHLLKKGINIYELDAEKLLADSEGKVGSKRSNLTENSESVTPVIKKQKVDDEKVSNLEISCHILPTVTKTDF